MGNVGYGDYGVELIARFLAAITDVVAREPRSQQMVDGVRVELSRLARNEDVSAGELRDLMLLVDFFEQRVRAADRTRDI